MAHFNLNLWKMGNNNDRTCIHSRISNLKSEIASDQACVDIPCNARLDRFEVNRRARSFMVAASRSIHKRHAWVLDKKWYFYLTALDATIALVALIAYFSRWFMMVHLSTILLIYVIFFTIVVYEVATFVELLTSYIKGRSERELRKTQLTTNLKRDFEKGPLRTVADDYDRIAKQRLSMCKSVSVVIAIDAIWPHIKPYFEIFLASGAITNLVSAVNDSITWVSGFPTFCIYIVVALPFFLYANAAYFNDLRRTVSACID